MVAIDSSILIALLKGEAGNDIELLKMHLREGTASLPPVVLTELLSGKELRPHIEFWIAQLRWLEPKPGFWERAGHARSIILSQQRKAKLADTLIAQSCIDHDIPLITRDTDFRHFAEHCGLRLAVA